jgi:hypothetical protein
MRGIFLLSDDELERARREITLAEKGGENVEDLWELMGELGAAANEVEARALLDSAEKDLSQRKPERALPKFRRLAAELQGTHSAEANRDRIERGLNKCRKAIAEQQDLRNRFEGAMERPGDGRVSVAYDFSDLFQLSDWEAAGEKDPDAVLAVEGELRLKGRRGLRWKAPFLGRVALTFELSVEEAGEFTEFLRLETEEREYVFRLGIEEKRILIRRRGAGDDWTTLGEKETPGVKVKAPVKVTVEAGPGGLLFHVDDGPVLRVPEPLTGRGRLSLWGTPTSVAYLNLRIKCHLDPEWVLR